MASAVAPQSLRMRAACETSALRYSTCFQYSSVNMSRARHISFPRRPGTLPSSRSTVSSQWQLIAPFSTTCQHNLPALPRARNRSLPSRPSRTVEMKEQQERMMQSGEVLGYIGLLDNTFIRPTRSPKLPSWTRATGERLRLEYQATFLKVWNRVRELIMSLSMVKPRPKFERARAAQIGADLFARMNTAFASGELNSVEEILAPGLLESLRKRVAQRAPNATFEWNLEEHVRKPRLVSYRFEIMPGPKGELKTERNGIFQAVVRLHSKQSLLRYRKKMSPDHEGTKRETRVLVDAHGQEIPWGALDLERQRSAKETVEYLVIQKYLKKGQPTEWVIWGTTEEMSLAQYKDREETRRKQLMAQS